MVALQEVMNIPAALSNLSTSPLFSSCSSSSFAKESGRLLGDTRSSSANTESASPKRVEFYEA